MTIGKTPLGQTPLGAEGSDDDEGTGSGVPVTIFEAPLGEVVLGGVSVVDGGEPPPPVGPPGGRITAVSTLTASGAGGAPAPRPRVSVGTVKIVGRSGLYGGPSNPDLYSTSTGTQTVERVGQVIKAGADGQREAYRIVVVDRQGTRIAELTDVRMNPVSEELNATGTFTFSLANRNPKTKYLSVPDTEIQVWRGKVLLWWGVVVRGRSAGSFVEFQCKDLSWYFDKRFFGRADRINYIKNPSFENGLAGWDWAPNVFRPIEDIPQMSQVVSISESSAFTGKRSLKLSQTAYPTEKLDFAVVQSLIWYADPTDNPTGETWTVAAWLYIEDFQAPALNQQGLMIRRKSTTEFNEGISSVTGKLVRDGKPLGTSNVPIDENTPRNKWVRMEAEIHQPPMQSVNQEIAVYLHPVVGTVYWDEVTLTRKERLGFYNKDQALIAQGIVEHAQDPEYGKSDLNIKTRCPLTGVRRQREYIMSEHGLIREAIDEFPTLHEGMDWSIEITAKTRTFTTHFPHRGHNRRTVVLELGENILNYDLSVDGERTANSVVVLGDGNGSDREEGGWSDDTVLSDGLILEDVYNATPGSDIQTLDDQAKRGVERFKNPVKMLSLTTIEDAGPLITKLKPGDVVHVKIDHGWTQIDEEYRIIRRDINPANDQMTLTLNQVSEELLKS